MIGYQARAKRLRFIVKEVRYETLHTFETRNAIFSPSRTLGCFLADSSNVLQHQKQKSLGNSLSRNAKKVEYESKSSIELPLVQITETSLLMPDGSSYGSTFSC
jgi:hypothetical protein